MKKQILTDEERRRRRNEASRRCYLKRKAELEGQKPVAAKNRKTAAKPKTKKTEPKRVRLFSKADPVKMAEKTVKRFAKVAGGLKPMLRDAASALAEAYKTGDEKTVLKAERVLAKGLGVVIMSPAEDDQAKTRIGIEAWSKALKTPAFRLNPPKTEPTDLKFVPFEPAAEEEDKDEPVEIPTDPSNLEKLESGETAKADIDIPSGAEDENDEDEDEDLENEDEDDEDDDSPEAVERRRIREERDSEREYEAGRWEMMGEMGEQGAFDD